MQAKSLNKQKNKQACSLFIKVEIFSIAPLFFLE
ncbi:hypothetical protein MY7_0280 [Bacillus sp. 5B6]|nr:hypothetical protein MY7_0280 [Bacillus sp. 5B6]